MSATGFNSLDGVTPEEIRIEMGRIQADPAGSGPITDQKETQITPSLGDDACLYGKTKDVPGASSAPVNPSGATSTASVAGNFLKDQINSFFQVSDNRLAMKLFGNKNALLREKMRQKAAGNWVIHPCSNFR